MSHLFAKPLERAETDALIEAKLRWILAETAPERVVLVGSAARYEMTDASDIDLILIFKSSSDVDAAKVRLYHSRPKDDWPHDLLFFEQVSYRASVARGGGVCWLAEKEGRTLFERKEK